MSKRCMGCMAEMPDELGVCPFCGYIEGTKPEEAIHILPGSILNNRYIVGKVLGYGSFGVTYIAWDGQLERKVAIKEYMPSEFSTRMPGQSCLSVFEGDKAEQFYAGLNKFVDEAKKVAKFNGEPGIVNVFDSFAENDTAYIVMEFLDGETLGERLKKSEHQVKVGNKTEIRTDPIPEDEAVALLTPVMESLKIVHKEGLIHRDIAPDNIFITKDGKVKLIDFGASRYATTSHSRSLTTIVKPGYSPKEQYDSRGDQGPHTDVYALAATLYKMITGKTPPEAMRRNANCETKHKDLLVEPHKIIKDISQTRENAVLNALNIRIQDRTPDVEVFLDELNADVPAKRRYGKIKKIDLYSWPLWLKITVASLLAAIVAFAVLLATGVIEFRSLFSDKIVVPEGTVIVPDVEGMDKDEAFKLLSDSQLTPSAEGNIVSDYVEVGKIVLQNPDGGSYLEENGVVGLTVSSGEGVVGPENGISTVPYVIWDTQDDAVAKLKQAGLSDPIIETKSDEYVAAGKVISQSTAAGEKVPEGTQITIVVSTGPAEFDMPNVIGKTKDNAEKTLSSKGLAVTVNYEKNDSKPEGEVFKQSVAAGKKVKKDDKITLTVSTGKSVVKVPDVVGKKKDDAKSALQKSGFDVNILENYDSNVAAGLVISQNPTAGSSQVKGSEITIYVSKGKRSYTVADVYNKTEAAAKSALSNFTVEVKYGGYSSSVAYGSVLSQSPAANTSLTEGSKVVLTLSKGPDWSGWSGDNPNLDTSLYDVQTETRYRYRDKETTTSGSSSMSGWQQYDSTWQWSDWGGWSGWSSSAVSNSDSRQIETKTVTDRAAYTNYRYWIYRADDGYGCGVKNRKADSGKLCNVYDEINLTYPLNMVTSGMFKGLYGPYNSSKFSHSYARYWFFGESKYVPAVTHTEYRYRDRSKVYTYYFYKWGGWSDYSVNAVSANDNRQVETKTYYRYRRK